MSIILKSTQPGDIRSSEITPEHVYRATRASRLSRRRFFGIAGAAGTAAALAACSSPSSPSAAPAATAGAGSAAKATAPVSPAATGLRDELNDPVNTLDEITNYNNYYEFTTDKEGVAGMAAGFKTAPWKVEIGGLVNKPVTLDLDDLRKKYPAVDRVYRLRCVEAWSMVIPWSGFPLAQLLKDAEPTSAAKFVKFTAISAPDQMPGQNDGSFPWPYTEGLRLDEAMNDLTLMATGLYGKPLPPQSGAPLRLAVPWKYGFKSIKAIVKIELVAAQPTSLWMSANAEEYGFYSNVNPSKPHPRWTQASERRIGESGRRRTLMFNGYESQVAGLYAGLDLQANY